MGKEINFIARWYDTREIVKKINWNLRKILKHFVHAPPPKTSTQDTILTNLCRVQRVVTELCARAVDFPFSRARTWTE